MQINYLHFIWKNVRGYEVRRGEMAKYEMRSNYIFSIDSKNLNLNMQFGDTLPTCVHVVCAILLRVLFP